MPRKRNPVQTAELVEKPKGDPKDVVVPPIRPQEQAYNALLTSMELLDVRFSRVLVEAPTIFLAEEARPLEPLVQTDGRYFNFGSGFVAFATLHFAGQYEDDDDPSVTAEAELELLFRSPIPMTDDHFEIFKARNLPLYARPYFREFLHSTIARTGWPAYTLPPISFEPAAIPEIGTLGEGLSE